MRTHSKLWLTAIMAAALFATAVGTASARNLSTSNSNIRADFRPLVFFNGEARLSCNVTIEGSFHYRTIVKSRLALVGYITRVTVDEANCRGGGLLAGARGRANRETLPWHISYEGFGGRLPLFDNVILLFHTDFTIFNIFLIRECRYGGNAVGFFERALNELRADETTGIPKTPESNGFCPANGFVQGRTRVTLLGTSTAVTVTLI